MIATVVSVSPLTVCEIGATTAAPASVVVGSSYVPAVNDLVVVLFTNGRFYILGGVA